MHKFITQLISVIILGLLLCALSVAAQAQSVVYIFQLDGFRVSTGAGGVQLLTPISYQGEFTLSDVKGGVYNGGPGETEQLFTGVITCDECAAVSVAEPFVNFGGQWRVKQKGILMIFFNLTLAVNLPNVAADGETYEGFLRSVTPSYRLVGKIRRKNASLSNGAGVSR